MDEEKKMETMQAEGAEAPEGKPKGRRSFVKRLLALLLTIAVILGVLLLTLLQDGRYLDKIRRWMIYGDADQSNSYAFAADSHNRFSQVGEDLVLVSQNYIQFLQEDGTVGFSQQVQLSQPALTTSDSLAAAYDVGGQNLYLCSKDAVLMEIHLEEGYGIISARINSKGWLAVVAQSSGYKATVSVYNSQQELVYEYNSSSRFLIDALVEENCGEMTAVALGEENGSFCTRLMTFPLDSDQMSREILLSNHLPLDLYRSGDCYRTIAENALVFTDADSGESAEYLFSGRYLRSYSLGGSDFAALLLTRYQAGSMGTLMTVDQSGAPIQSLEITQEVLDLSAAGNYVAVLMSNTLVIYNRELEEYSRLSDTGYANRVIMHEDGSAIVIGGSFAFRYLP